MKSKIIMEYLFPNPTKYEKNYNNLPLIAFKALMLIENEYKLYIKMKNIKIKELDEKIKINKNKVAILNIFFILFICFLFTMDYLCNCE